MLKLTEGGIGNIVDNVKKTQLFHEQMTAWHHLDAKNYIDEMWSVFGIPDILTGQIAKWHHVDGFDTVMIKDESVNHDFPVPHQDFVYSTKKIKVPPQLATPLAKVTGSIIIDGLKWELTARCGMLVKNAVTMGFVEDVVAGRAKPTPAEYSRRIIGQMVPIWYADEMNEGAVPLTEAEETGA